MQGYFSSLNNNDIQDINSINMIMHKFKGTSSTIGVIGLENILKDVNINDILEDKELIKYLEKSHKISIGLIDDYLKSFSRYG